MTLRVLVAPEFVPVKVSPAANDPDTEATSRTFVVEFQDLTLAVTPVVDPVTTSLNKKSPVFDPPVGEAMEIVGANEYPSPAFVR